MMCKRRYNICAILVVKYQAAVDIKVAEAAFIDVVWCLVTFLYYVLFIYPKLVIDFV
jgi:hypothetical protein